MGRTIRRASWLALLVLVPSGCLRPRHPHGMPPGAAVRVTHVHGPACGHVLVGGVWVLKKGPGRHGHPWKH